jgi:hypothetical protein
VGSSVSALPGHRAANRGRRLPAVQKVERDRAVVIDRNKGLPWPLIAQRHGLSERQCRNIYADWREGEKAMLLSRDPMEWLVETLARMDSIIAFLAEIAEEADNDAARVGALRSQMVAIERQTALLVASGLLPRNLRASREYEDVVAMVNSMIAVAERHDVGPHVIDDFLAVIDGAGGDVSPPRTERAGHE